jgi:hypothetical protein
MEFIYYQWVKRLMFAPPQLQQIPWYKSDIKQEYENLPNININKI